MILLGYVKMFSSSSSELLLFWTFAFHFPRLNALVLLANHGLQLCIIIKKFSIVCGVSLHRFLWFLIMLGILLWYRVFTIISIKYSGTKLKLLRVNVKEKDLVMGQLGCSHHLWWLLCLGNFTLFYF